MAIAIAIGADTHPSALAGLSRMTIIKQLVLMVALAGSIALGVGVALWSQTPQYALLFGSLSGKDAAQILNALEAAGTPFNVDRESGRSWCLRRMSTRHVSNSPPKGCPREPSKASRCWVWNNRSAPVSSSSGPASSGLSKSSWRAPFPACTTCKALGFTWRYHVSHRSSNADKRPALRYLFSWPRDAGSRTRNRWPSPT